MAMKRFAMSLCAAVVLPSLVVMELQACAPKAIARTVVDVALAMCVAENPGLDERELAEVCHYAQELAPIVRELTSAQRRGAQKAAARRDGGE